MNILSDKEEHANGDDEAELETVVDVEESGEAYVGDTLKKLRESLRACEKERQEFLDGWQRSKADFLNQRKRLDEDRRLSTERAENALIGQILNLADSFDMAFKNKDAWSAIDATWAKGIEGIYAQLQSILREYGVAEIEAEGAHFNPALHEAYASKPVDSEEAHDTVVEVAQKGYIRGDTVLRPARVVIGSHHD